MNSFSEALHEELCGTGVHVQTLCPGFTYTEFQQRAGVDISKIPTFAWMTPEAVVDASLRALQRRQVVCVPGLVNRLLALCLNGGGAAVPGAPCGRPPGAPCPGGVMATAVQGETLPLRVKYFRSAFSIA